MIIPSVIVWDGNQNRDRTLAFAVMNTLGKSRSTEFVNLPAFSGEFHAVLFLMYFMRCLSVIISFHNGVSVSKNIFQDILKKDASDKMVMRVSRIVLLVVTAIGVLIALDEDSVIFTIVSFAWAGFGATFGPVMLFSLFWKRLNRTGAVAGMLTGGGMVFVWKLLLKPLGGVFSIYELFPAFVISCLVIVIVSLCTKEPPKEIQEEFDRIKAGIEG